MNWRWSPMLGFVGIAIMAACSSGGSGGTSSSGGQSAKGGGSSGGSTSGGASGALSGGISSGGLATNTSGGAGGHAAGGSTSGGSTSGGNAGGGGANGGSSNGGNAGGGGANGGSATAGMAGGGAANGGAGGDAPATLMMPIMRSASSYVLEFGDLYFEVNPMIGARIVDVHLKGGMNVLSPSSVDPGNYGSTFWPSPQTWPWPPTDPTSIANIDNEPFTPATDATSMTLTGAASDAVKLSVTKKFTADLAKQAVVVTYTMIGSASGAMAAPWEISRLPQSGVTFWPTGSAPQTSGTDFTLPTTTTAAGCTWLETPSMTTDKSAKLRADGTGGWLAHAANDWVLVKKFTDTPAASVAPNEGEIEVFVSMNGMYIEVEQQGAYAAVPQSPPVTWDVTWILRHLPSGAMATAGNQALVDFVKSLVQ